jgi:trigger factor
VDLNLKNLENCKREFSAFLNYEELMPHFEKAILEYRKKVTIPGFRKGKAPLNMVKKLYSDNIEYSALEDIANEIFIHYLDENHIHIIDKGSLVDIDYKLKEQLTFKIIFEVFPEVELKSYKNFELLRDKYFISDSIVDDEIKNIMFNFAQYDIDAQALNDEYRITVDTQELDESGCIIVGNTTKDTKIYLGNKNIFPEFKEGLKDIKENEERIIETKNADGNPKKVKIICTKVEKITYPELNEEFFKKATGKEFKTEDEFRSFIKDEIINYYKGISDKKLEKDIISEIIKLNEIEIPEKFIESILRGYLEDYKKMYKKAKFTKEQEEEYKKSRRVDAIKQAKWFFFREKLIDLEKIEVSDDDFLKFAKKNIKIYNLPLEAEVLVKTYKENNDVKYSILEDKIFEFLTANADIEEIEIDLNKKNNEEEIIS